MHTNTRTAKEHYSTTTTNHRRKENGKSKKQNQRDDEPHTTTQAIRDSFCNEKKNSSENSLDEIDFLFLWFFTLNINIMDSPIRRFTKQHSHINNEIQMCRPATRRSSFNFGFNCSRENIRIHLANQPRTRKEHRCVSSTAKSRFLFCYFVSFHENIRILCKMKTQNKGRQEHICSRIERKIFILHISEIQF